MARQRALRVLVATDGSRDAKAAIATTLHFPWAAETRVRIISARRSRAEYRRSILLSALDRGAEKATENARRTLARRWPDVDVEIADKTPVEGILDAAKRFKADVIVVGWRGHGAVRVCSWAASPAVSSAVPRARYSWCAGRSTYAHSSSVSTAPTPQSAP